MTTTRALWSLLLCVCLYASDEKADTPAFACNRKAIRAAERPRYHDLVNRMRTAIRHRNELSNGYAFKLDGKAITLPETAEWLRLTASGNQADWLLTLTSPAGVKPLIAAEFTAP